MTQYAPAIPPVDQDNLLPYLNDEFVRVAQSLNNLDAGLWTINYVLPSKLKPGLVKYFDGTNADPLMTGKEGIYYYGLDSNWHFLGIPGSGTSVVNSVNGQTGDVVLDYSDVGADPAGTAATAITNHEAASDPHPQYALEANLATVATTGAFSDLVGVPTLVRSVVAGSNVTVDNTDPLNPVVSATVPPSGVESVVAGTNITVDNTDPANPIVKSSLLTRSPGGVDLPTEFIWFTGNGLNYSSFGNSVILTVNADGVYRGFIDGLEMEYVSSSSIKVKTGSAWILNGDSTVNLTSDATLSSLAPAAGTFLHIYVNKDISTNLLLASSSTLSPNPPYFANARARSNNTGFRYVGSILGGTGSVVQPFYQTYNKIFYTFDSATAPLRILSGGTATTYTNVSTSAVAPLTAKVLVANVRNSGTANAYLRPTMGTWSAGVGMFTLSAGDDREVHIPLDGNQTIAYMVDVGGSLTIDVIGYEFAR